MQIEVFVLCDAATGDLNKLSMLGAFDTILVKETPATHPQCAIALRVRFERIERGEHKVVVHFADADGKNVLPPAQGVMNINFSDNQSSTSANLILNIQGLKLERFGEYSIDLAIDGQLKASLPLFVKEHKATRN
jgi:hypothetical protein